MIDNIRANTPIEKFDFLVQLEPGIEKCRDFYIGASAVKEGGKYLKKWSSETEGAYLLRKRSTAFVNYYLRYVQAFTSLVFQKPPIINNLDDFDIDNVDMEGNSFSYFIRQCFTSSVVAGVEFIAVIADDPKKKRAYFKRYKYEQLQSFRRDKNRSSELTQIVFKEEVELEEGRFGVKKAEQWIVFEKKGGSIWTKNDFGNLIKKAEWKNSLDEVPVVPIITGRSKSCFLDCDPLLYDIVDMNHVLLEKNTQMEFISIKGARPLMVIYGMLDDKSLKENLNAGVGDVMMLRNKDECSVEYIESRNDFVGDNIKQIELLVNQMSEIYFNLLKTLDSKTIVEAHDNQNKGASFLRSSIEQLESASMKLFRYKAHFENRTLPEDAKVEFVNNFDDFILTKDMLGEFIEMVNLGIITPDQLVQKLMKAGVINSEDIKKKPKKNWFSFKKSQKDGQNLDKKV